MPENVSFKLVVRPDGAYDFRYGPPLTQGTLPEILRKVADEVEQGQT